MDNAASEPNEIIDYVWMLGVPPPAQRRMSTAAEEACYRLFERKYATFKNGRLPGSDAEIKAVVAFFSIKVLHISARLLEWRKLKQVASPALSLGSHGRGEVKADIENRIDGADLVSEELELLVSDLAFKEGVELEALRVWVVASDEFQDVLCAMVAQWTADVLLCTAEKSHGLTPSSLN
jgi:hypothetical protein